MQPLHVTWMILRDDNRVLLGYKKRGFGTGYLNGIGGKVDSEETIRQAAVRETKEEIGVKVTKFAKVATIIFDDLFYKGTRQQNIMHCFVASAWEGEPIETDEIRPEWFEVNQIPYDEMWADDEFWLPQVLAGNKIKARFRLNDNYKIINQIVNVLPN